MAELGALSLKIQAEGDGVVLKALDAVDKRAKAVGSTPVSVRFDARGAQEAAKATSAAAAGAKAAQPAQAALNKEINASIQYYSLLARTADTTNRAMVDDVRGGITAQRAYAQSVGASAEQMLRLELVQDQFERRVVRGGAAVQAISPKVRTGTAALSALAIAVATGSNSLSGMATAAGIAASSMAETFGTGKLASYASGLGAVTIAATALYGILTKLAEAKPLSAVVQQRLANTRTLIDAEVKLAQLRERQRLADAAAARPLSQQLGGFSGLAFLGTLGRKPANEARQAQTDVEEFLKVYQQLQSEERRARFETQVDAREAFVQGEVGIVVAGLTKQRAAEDAAFSAGQRTLKDYYATRAATIRTETAQEVRLLEAQRAALLTKAGGPGVTPVEAEAFRAQAGAITPQIAAARTRGEGKLIENAAAEAAALKQNAALVLALESRVADAQGRNHETRLQQLAAERDGLIAIYVQQGLSADAAAQKADAALGVLQTQVNAQQALADLQLQLSQVETQRQQINNDLALGLIDQEEAARRIADVERASLPTLQEMVDRIATMAAILKDPELIANVEKLRAALGTLGANTSAIDRIKSTAQSMAQSLAGGIAQAFSDAFSNQDGGDPVRRFGAQVLSALGDVFVQIGVANIKAGALLKGLAKFLINNPVAAIGIGVALSALGRSLGGGRGGGGSSGGGGGGGGTSGGGAITSYVYGPNALTPIDLVPAGVRGAVQNLRGITQQRYAVGSGSLQFASPAVGPSFGRPVVLGTPESQRLITADVNSHRGRGG